MPRPVFIPLGSTRPKIPHTTTRYQLCYVATWTGSLCSLVLSDNPTAPTQQPAATDIALALDPHSGAFLICQYHQDEKRWTLVGVVDPKTVNAYITDSCCRVRILSWCDPGRRKGLEVYWDLAFAVSSEFQLFLGMVDRGPALVEMSTMYPESEMVEMFGQVPEKGRVLFPNSLVEREKEPYCPATTRDYRSELAGVGSSTVVVDSGSEPRSKQSQVDWIFSSDAWMGRGEEFPEESKPMPLANSSASGIHEPANEIKPTEGLQPPPSKELHASSSTPDSHDLAEESQRGLEQCTEESPVERVTRIGAVAA